MCAPVTYPPSRYTAEVPRASEKEVLEAAKKIVESPPGLNSIPNKAFRTVKIALKCLPRYSSNVLKMEHFRFAF